MAQAVGEGSGEPFRNLRPAPGSLSRSSPSSESVYNLKQNKALLIPSNRIEIGTHPKQPSCRRGGRAGPRVERRPPSGRAWTCACAACGIPGLSGQPRAPSRGVGSGRIGRHCVLADVPKHLATSRIVFVQIILHSVFSK